MKNDAVRSTATGRCALLAVAVILIITAVAAPAWCQDAAQGESAQDEPTQGELNGLAIAKNADQAQRSKTEHNVMTMTLENSRGQQRVRTIEGYGNELSDEEEHRFAKFLEPSDVKDTTLLTYDYDEKDDDIWLYLPALKKVKRILSSNKTDYFMGSDFTYWDMENLDFTNWKYERKEDQQVEGVDCYVIEATPLNETEADESGYSKTVSWIGKADFLPRKIEYYDRKDRLTKRLTASDIHPTSETDPRPRPHKLVMENFVTKHKTVLSMDVLQLDVEVDKDVFSQRNLRQ